MSELIRDPQELRDPYEKLRAATPARIGLGRAGDSLPTSALLDFQLAHARARDAVHGALDAERLAASLPLPSLQVHSRASDVSIYLRRPDLGRRLDVASREKLAGQEIEQDKEADILFVIADGLSAGAVQAQAAALVAACLPLLSGLQIGPVVIVRQGRVAIGDEIGEVLGAKLVAVLSGERPGLSVADSLGVYLTFAPRLGRRDSERNCISNIHGQGGLSIEQAAAKLAWLAREGLRRGLTGVELKDEAGALPDQAEAQPLSLSMNQRPAGPGGLEV